MQSAHMTLQFKLIFILTLSGFVHCAPARQETPKSSLKSESERKPYLEEALTISPFESLYHENTLKNFYLEYIKFRYSSYTEEDLHIFDSVEGFLRGDQSPTSFQTPWLIPQIEDMSEELDRINRLKVWEQGEQSHIEKYSKIEQYRKDVRTAREVRLKLSEFFKNVQLTKNLDFYAFQASSCLFSLIANVGEFTIDNSTLRSDEMLSECFNNFKKTNRQGILVLPLFRSDNKTFSDYDITSNSMYPFMIAQVTSDIHSPDGETALPLGHLNHDLLHSLIVSNRSKLLRALHQSFEGIAKTVLKSPQLQSALDEWLDSLWLYRKKAKNSLVKISKKNLPLYRYLVKILSMLAHESPVATRNLTNYIESQKNFSSTVAYSYFELGFIADYFTKSFKDTEKLYHILHKNSDKDLVYQAAFRSNSFSFGSTASHILSEIPQESSWQETYETINTEFSELKLPLFPSLQFSEGEKIKL